MCQPEEAVVRCELSYAAEGRDVEVRTLITSLTVRDLVWHQAPAFLVSLLTAEAFFKFGSFTLECIAFLATWFVADLFVGMVMHGGGRKAI